MWDGRSGRWNTTDAYMQFHSPYLGMGNNPIAMIDPDGGKGDPLIDSYVWGSSGSSAAIGLGSLFINTLANSLQASANVSKEVQGRLASKSWPPWIHERIIREAGAGILTEEQISLLIAASEETDTRKGAQSAKNSYKHYMRGPFQSKKSAEKKAKEFIKKSKKEFIMGQGEQAWKALGEGGHTIMDKTSPMHYGKRGPRIWFGNINVPFAIFYHAPGEFNILGISEKKVQQAVEDYRNYLIEAIQEKNNVTGGK